MAKTKFELNISGLNELMMSDEMDAVLDAAGNAVASAAGPDYAKRTHKASFVSICNVYPDSKEASTENLEENTLLKAIGAVGLPTSK